MIGSNPVYFSEVQSVNDRQTDKWTIIEPSDCRSWLKARGSGCEQASPNALSPLKRGCT